VQTVIFGCGVYNADTINGVRTGFSRLRILAIENELYNEFGC
jgi:hypothetical protein